MANDDRWRRSERGEREGRHEDDRGFAGPRREPISEQSGRGRREFSGDIYSGSSGREGRDWESSREDREGFWGRGHGGGGYQGGGERRDYSREDYGASNYGGDDRGGIRESFGGSFSRTGEEGRGSQGYGRQRDADFGDEASGRSYVGNEGRGFNYGSDYRGSYGGGGHGGDDRGREGYGNRGGQGGGGERGGQGERGLFAKAADEVSSWFGDRDAERRREQDHRGRGPKGYKRSDQRIQEDVNDRLSDDPHVDASDIEVSVSSGEVTLSGSVDSRQARRRAEDVAEQVSGVGYVQNNIRVQGAGGGAGSASSATSGQASAGGGSSGTAAGSMSALTGGSNGGGATAGSGTTGGTQPSRT